MANQDDHHVHHNDALLDLNDQEEMLQLFTRERNLTSFLMLLKAYLCSEHYEGLHVFAAIRNALTQIADLPRENEQELINVFAYVIDIIEESDDPWQLDAQVVDNDFIILCRNKASIHLPPEHVYTLKLWLLSLYFCDDPYGELQLFLRSGIEKSALALVFPLGGNVIFHCTGSFIDQNVKNDPLRGLRYKFMRFFLLFHAFNELESEILGSIIHCIEEARNMRLSFNFLERRPGEEGLADLNAILARFLVLAGEVKANPSDGASNIIALYYIAQASSVLLGSAGRFHALFVSILRKLFRTPNVTSTDITNIFDLARTLPSHQIAFLVTHVRISVFASLMFRNLGHTLLLLDTLRNFLASYWLWNSRSHRDVLLLQVLEDKLRVGHLRKAGKRYALSRKLRFIREVREYGLQEIGQNICSEVFESITSKEPSSMSSSDFAMSCGELEMWKSFDFFSRKHLHSYYNFVASWELSQQNYTEFITSMIRYTFTVSKLKKIVFNSKNLMEYEKVICVFRECLQSSFSEDAEANFIFESLFRTQGGTLDFINHMNQILVQLHCESNEERPPSLKKQALQTFLKEEERILQEVNGMFQNSTVRHALTKLALTINLASLSDK